MRITLTKNLEERVCSNLEFYQMKDNLWGLTMVIMTHFPPSILSSNQSHCRETQTKTVIQLTITLEESGRNQQNYSFRGTES